MIISLDTETTGCDFAHGVMPFLVTTCDNSRGPDAIKFWEWDVDPLTRVSDVPSEDVVTIAELIDAADKIFLQGSKFDARALAAINIQLPWDKVSDTLAMGHLLASNHRHDLTAMCIEYLGVDIESYELHVKEVTRACRDMVKHEYPYWKIAQEGDPDMPSVKKSSKRDEDKPWKNDMWLPRALLKQKHLENRPIFGDTTWTTACSKYANADSEHTLYLGLEMERLIRERGYWKIYQHRLDLPRVACEMECYGVTAIGEYTESVIADYQYHVAESGAELVSIAQEFGYELELAEGASINDNMRGFFYGSVEQRCTACKYTKRIKHWNGDSVREVVCPKCSGRKRKPVNSPLVTSRRDNLKLNVVYGHKTGSASLDKDAMQEYLTTLQEGPGLDFIRLLTDKRKHETDLTYMQSYRRFWVPVPGAIGYYRIHPSLNPFGTDHLRWASNSPNLQNVSTQEEKCEECDGEGCPACGGTGKARLSVRACFGPAPDREWWDADFRNLEKRIPVFECGEKALIEVFEKPNEPPYWGSDHNVLASLIFPDDYWPLAEVRDGFKKKHLQKYKKIKNTNFAKQYGAGKRKVDATAGVVGAYEKIERGLPEIAKLQASCLAKAEWTGWVETLPDRTVDPDRGYPVLASRTEDGRILSTTPFNYKVSGTACWVKNTALVCCAARCAQWRAEGFDAHVALEVHDSILFDFPRGRTPEENLPRAMELKALMEQSGTNLVPSIPTPVSVEYITESWAKGVTIC